MSTTQADRYPSRVGGTTGGLQPRRDPVVWGGLDTRGPLGREDLARYEDLGFLVRPDLFGPSEVESVRRELEDLAEAPSLASSDLLVREPDGDGVRSIFDADLLSTQVAAMVEDHRLVGVAEQLLGSPVYRYQCRVNYKPAFEGRPFAWHSDFETWHVEDGMPSMRALSISVALTPNKASNGPLMLVPGSQQCFLACAGDTPDDHFRVSLRNQQHGVPDGQHLEELIAPRGIELILGDPGSAVFFDCNVMHGSSGNMSPYPRVNLFVVFNSVDNRIVEPFGGRRHRPAFLGR